MLTVQVENKNSMIIHTKIFKQGLSYIELLELVGFCNSIMKVVNEFNIVKS